jgi:hypothetical protein
MYGLLYECKFLTIEETNKKKDNENIAQMYIVMDTGSQKCSYYLSDLKSDCNNGIKLL